MPTPQQVHPFLADGTLMVMPSLLLLALLSAACPTEEGLVDLEQVASSASHRFLPAEGVGRELILCDAVEGNVEEEDGEDEVLLCGPCRAIEDRRLPTRLADFPLSPFDLSIGLRRQSLRAPPRSE
jgi:hypothetical protein